MKRYVIKFKKYVIHEVLRNQYTPVLYSIKWCSHESLQFLALLIRKCPLLMIQLGIFLQYDLFVVLWNIYYIFELRNDHYVIFVNHVPRPEMIKIRSSS